MALNPPLQPNRHPAPVQGEYLVLVRKNIEAEIVLENRQKYKGKGKLYLTTLRLVFVNDKNEAMSSFDVPIDLMKQEKFNQPIFGANYISGHVLPLYNLIPCPANFKFWFMSGGTGTFLPLFYNIVDQIRKRRQHGNHGPDPRFIECVANGNLRNVAYVDPNDPSVIFIQQPNVDVAPTYNTGYYFPQPGMVQPPAPMPYPQGNPASYNAPSNISNAPAYNNPQPVYSEAPVYNAVPVYNAAPVYSGVPVYNSAPGHYNPAPGQYNPAPGQYIPPAPPHYNPNPPSNYPPGAQVPNYPLPGNPNSNLPPSNHSHPPPVQNPNPSAPGYSSSNPYVGYS